MNEDETIARITEAMPWLSMLVASPESLVREVLENLKSYDKLPNDMIVHPRDYRE